MAWGEYPAEYNPKVHGPYDPARFYGKGKTHLCNQWSCSGSTFIAKLCKA